MKVFSKINDKQLRDIIKGGSTNFLFYALNIIVVYVLSIVISKWYGAEVFGRFAIIKSLILILIIFSTLGLNTLVVKHVSDEKYFKQGVFRSDFLTKAYLIIFTTTLIIAGLVYFNKHNLAVHIFGDELLEDYFLIFPLVLLSAVLLNFNSNLFKGQGRIALFSILSSFLSNTILISAIYLIFIFYSQNELYIMLCLAFSLLIACIVSFFYIFPIKWAATIYKIKSKNILASSFPMMISASMIYLIFSVDTLMLGMLETTENVGIYRIASQISSIISIFVIVLGAVIAPKIAKLYAEKKFEDFKNLIRNSTKLLFFISVPLLLLILIFASVILNFFGENFHTGYYALIILAIGQFLFVSTGFVDIILNMTGHQKIFGKITMFTAALNIVLNLVLIPSYGINGAAMATGFSIVINNVIGLIYIKKKLEVLSLYLPLPKS